MDCQVSCLFILYLLYMELYISSGYIVIVTVLHHTNNKYFLKVTCHFEDESEFHYAKKEANKRPNPRHYSQCISLSC